MTEGGGGVVIQSMCENLLSGRITGEGWYRDGERILNDKWKTVVWASTGLKGLSGQIRMAKK